MSSAPFDRYRAVVQPEWIDENQHMNMGYYMVVFDKATDAWLDHLGLDLRRRERDQVATFTLEGHIHYLRELREGAPLRFTTQLLGWDAKRIHYFHQLYHAEQGYLAATNELLSLHVSLESRRAATIASDVRARLQSVAERHAELPRPPQVGHRIGLSRD